METATFQTPVVLIVFNRPETTRVVFAAIAKIRPAKLLVIGDGPRANKPGEEVLCTQVRDIVQAVEWPCELLTNFSKTNLGCQERVVSGLNWAFSLVEEAIILEDDCLPDLSFFPFCEELLDRYRGDGRIAMISGNNFVSPSFETNYSYYFSRICHIWGWATWRSAWQRYDRYLENWESVRHDGALREIYLNKDHIDQWSQVFESMKVGTGPDTWDYQWAYTNITNSRLSIVPRVNMVSNIGFGNNATHTVDSASKWSGLAFHAMTFPLRHPPYVIPLRSFDELEQLESTSRFRIVLKQKLRSLLTPYLKLLLGRRHK